MSKDSRGGLPPDDLARLIVDSELLFDSLRSAKILLAGGTGFVGTWLSGALLEANASLNLDLDLTVVTRSKTVALSRIKPRAEDPVSFIETELKYLVNQVGEGGKPFTHFIHGANSTRTIPESDKSKLKSDAEESTLAMLSMAESSNVVPVFMHLSSGAVFGQDARRFPSLSENRLAETPSDSQDSYTYIKCRNEEMVLESTQQGLIRGTNPRLFAFLGPHLPLDGHFAIGNFVNSALTDGKIEILGNPRSTRSYLYPTDLVEWLLAVLLSPTADAINIGSGISYSMAEIAELVCKEFGGSVINYGNPEIAENHYVPDISRTQTKYGVKQKINLEEGLRRWHAWLRDTQSY